MSTVGLVNKKNSYFIVTIILIYASVPHNSVKLMAYDSQFTHTFISNKHCLYMFISHLLKF